MIGSGGHGGGDVRCGEVRKKSCAQKRKKKGRGCERLRRAEERNDGVDRVNWNAHVWTSGKTTGAGGRLLSSVVVAAGLAVVCRGRSPWARASHVLLVCGDVQQHWNAIDAERVSTRWRAILWVRQQAKRSCACQCDAGRMEGRKKCASRTGQERGDAPRRERKGEGGEEAKSPDDVEEPQARGRKDQGEIKRGR